MLLCGVWIYRVVIVLLACCVLGAEPRGELVTPSYGRLVLDAEGKVGLAAIGVGRQREEQLGWLAMYGVRTDR